MKRTGLKANRTILSELRTNYQHCGSFRLGGNKSGIKNFAEVLSAKHIRQRKSWQKTNT
jgi:hypothetical protein